MSAEKLAARAETLREKVRKLHQEIEHLTRRAIAACNHPDIVECEYSSGYFCAPDPPLRVCRVCGMCEEGWNCGYQELKGLARTVSREHVYKLRRVVQVPNHVFVRGDRCKIISGLRVIV